MIDYLRLLGFIFNMTDKTKELEDEIKPIHKIVLNISKHGDVLEEDEKDIYNYISEVYKQARQEARKETLKDIEKMIDNHLIFHSKHIKKHFENNNINPSNMQVKKEVKHKYCKYQLEQIKQNLKDLEKK